LTTSQNNLLCIWYPSGGFGHFVNAVLSLYGSNFAKPQASLEFGPTGNSHSFPLLMPKYQHNLKNYTIPKLDPQLFYTVLIDNGINDESTVYLDCFPGSRTLKLCYSDFSWSIVARTMIEKALVRELSSEIYIDPSSWPVDEDWALREKYFLYLRDHPLRHKWKPSEHCHNVFIDELVTYETMSSSLSIYGLADYYNDWQRWKEHNKKYISPMEIAFEILQNVDNRKPTDLFVQDIWTQSVTNYFIWLKYAVEVPANDYANWFTNTQQIVTLLEDHGVIV